MSEKYFIFIEKSRFGDINHCGVERFNDIEAAFEGPVRRMYTFEEMMNLNLSKTIMRKIETCKPGSWIHIRKSHMNADFGCYCVDDVTRDAFFETERLKQEVTEINEKIDELTSEELKELHREKQRKYKLANESSKNQIDIRKRIKYGK